MNSEGVQREIVIERVTGRITQSVLEGVSQEELDQARKDYQVSKQCDHSLVVDERGWMYDFRKCAVCGEGLGAI